MTLRSLTILPPLAIGRLGSAPTPMDNYRIEDDPAQPLGWRRLVPEPTLVVDEARGEIVAAPTPDSLHFKDRGKVRPVAPFLEVFATAADGTLEPLTLSVLERHGLGVEALSWRVIVANRKVARRTDNRNDVVQADTGWFGDHASHDLKGHCRNFVSPEAFVDFGRVRFIKPNGEFPQIRLRFTPAHGLIYGPAPAGEQEPDPFIAPERQIYDPAKGWPGFGADDAAPAPRKRGKPAFRNETLPPSLFAIEPPAPSWLHNNIAISRGYLDDACDGFVEVKLQLGKGKVLTATARICAAPPAMVPDSLFVRSLADDLEQVIHGPDVAADEPDHVTRTRAEDIVRRAFETVRFMNVAVMNGNNFKGRSALSLDSMPEEEAADTQRAIRPVMPPETVDTFTIMALHEQVYAALRGGAAPWFLRLLRQPDEVADFTDRGRRKMPAMMCGADNNYLALTYRQIDTIRKTADHSIFDPPEAPAAPDTARKLEPRNRTAAFTAADLSRQVNYAAAGNPVSSRPETSVANCCPGLELDFRAVWRRIFKGLVLREYDSLVVDVDADCPQEARALKGHRLLQIHLPGESRPVRVVTVMTGPASSDPDNEIRLTTEMNPAGLAPLEWSNALTRVLRHAGRKLRCDFTAAPAWELGDVSEPFENMVSRRLEVRAFFDDDSAVISRALAEAGELTQGLCSPWQNDYRECSCYYWASARPDYVNVEPTDSGLSQGDNWLQKTRTGDYVPDDYVDSRLVNYDDLFLRWEHWLRFQVGGRDADDGVDTANLRPRGKRS